MPDLKTHIITDSTIEISDPYDLQTWIILWLKMSGLFHIGYPGYPCSLPFMN